MPYWATDPASPSISRQFITAFLFRMLGFACEYCKERCQMTVAKAIFIVSGEPVSTPQGSLVLEPGASTGA